MANNTPLVAAALICERVIEESDGVLTAVRIVDTFYIRARPKEIPDSIKPGVQFHVLVMLKSGELVGTFTAGLILRYPSGKTQEMGKYPINLNGGEHGANFIARMGFTVKEWGLHWFDLTWEDQATLTSIPLKVVRAEADQNASPVSDKP